MDKIFRNSAKTILIAVFPFILFIGSAFAQDRTAQHEKIVATTVEAINNRKPEMLEEYLAADFTFSEQEPRISKIVLTQLLRLSENRVNEYSKTGESDNNGEWTLVYEFIYDGELGRQTTTFVFDDSGRLKKLDLFAVQVKVLSVGQSLFEKSGREIIEIPVEISKNIPMAKAVIDGQSRWFILDSGASKLVLNSNYFKSGADDANSTKTISNVQGVNSAVSNIDIVHVGEFDFGGIRLTDSNVLTMDMSHLEEKLGRDIYGIIGYEVYKDYDMLFDYGGGTITLIEPYVTENYIATSYGQTNIEKIVLEMRAHCPVVRGEIAGMELNLGIDCGAGSNLLDQKFFDVLKEHVSMSESRELSGAGESKTVELCEVEELTIGNRKFYSTITAFNDMSHMNTADTSRLDGLIGYEILSKQRTLLSFQNLYLSFID